MERKMTRGEQNLLLLQSLIPESEKLYVWCYDTESGPVASSCPEGARNTLDRAFRLFDGPEQLKKYALDPSVTRPRIIGSPIGMQWALSYESERERKLIFVIGPTFYHAPTEEQLRDSLRPYIHNSENAAWGAALFALLPELPVMTYAVFTRYVIMVHNTLTGQKLDLDALDPGVHPEDSISTSPAGERNRKNVYLSEQAMLHMVRTGNINYQRAIQNSIRLSPGVPVQGRDPLRQMKTSIIVFTTLVSRAAMEGGLSPEVAYSLGDSYIQSAEDCRDSGALSALAFAMYHDFIYRVHYLNTNPDYSHAVRKCIDYIDLSLDRKIRVSELADLVGYTEYYLTEKFRKETGLSVSRYIRKARIDRARLLLETSGLSVREISERLAFNTVNYFIQCFREDTGSSPAQYRKKHQKP